MPYLSITIEHAGKINKKIIPALKRLGIFTVRDLLFHIPSRYEDFSNMKPISEVAAEERVTIEGEITSLKSFRTRAKGMHITTAAITDESGTIEALWFNQPFLARALHVGLRVRLSGKPVLGKKGIVLQNPAHEKISAYATEAEQKGIHTSGLVPIYPETAGITSRWLRWLIKSYISARKELRDPLPEKIAQQYILPHLHDAIAAIHFPETKEEAERAKRRFAFEELLLIQLRALRERSRLKQYQAPAILLDVSLIQEFVKQLPFILTDAQKRSLWEILKDIEKPKPMNRLLEGDVGSGKTIIAAAASLIAAHAGRRVLFMAPTEILARQHFETVKKFLLPFHISIGLLTGSEKKIIHVPDIIIGTHALIQKHLQFENLGLVIVDEQHRFGVEQRMALQKKRGSTSTIIPHFLSMSATPIPRTLALTIYGDLDLSIIDELPKSRRQIMTKIVSSTRRTEAYSFIRKEIQNGRQVFIICPKIETKPDERRETSFSRAFLNQEVKAVKEEYERLKKEIFPDLKLAVLHGKMKPKEKNEIMQEFKNRTCDILVSTSVIEVGVDVPNATIMLIEGAERFGLAQLHQFRGRVGRGEHQSYCFLFCTEDGVAANRLRAIVEAKNGFELAEKDLAIRGPGDLFGGRQSGIPDLALANITNAELVRAVRMAAREIVSESPDLKKFPALAEALRKFEQAIHLE
ncbi:MAG: ATP-dependent DNA helicase RecG [Candidatus Sungbacteria bacterium]|nr:ATP-dependent DNA helicase RecG [Candidatus Sungbacteria bacterium]